MSVPAPVAADTELAQALFAPRAVALIGASADPAKTGARPLRYLRRHGFSGRILPINPRRSEIDGVCAYPSLAAAPGPIDHAFVMCRAEEAAEAIAACGAAGVRVATVLSDGFAETGPAGQARQDALLAAARAAGVRLLGPNSIGVIDTAGFTCSANAALELPDLPRGGLGVVSQSGSLIGALLSHGAARGIGFAQLVSVGNEADLGVAEIAGLMLDDPRCAAVLLFLEAIRDRAGLVALAAQAAACGKPVIAYKLGRSAAGQALAATHTGALAGDDAMVSALLADLGIARVEMFEALLEAPPLFTSGGPAAGRRVAVMTTTGGGGSMVVDCLGAQGITAVPPPPEVAALLQDAGLPDGRGGLIDLTLAGTRPDLVARVLDGLMRAEGIDAVAMVIGSSAQFHPDLAVAPLLRFAGQPRPFAVYIVPEAEQSRRRLTEAGIAVFRTPESCAEGLRARLARRPPRPEVLAPVPPLAAPAAARIAALMAEARAAGRTATLDEARALALFAALGVDAPAGALLALPEGAEAPEAWVTACADACAGLAAGDASARFVAKIASPDIAHKTEIGGVALNLAGPETAAACAALTARARAALPAARLDGVLLQRMRAGVAEALLGYRRDPALGPMVLVGAGGTLAELMRETALRPAPVDLATARAMIAEVPALRLAQGFRNRPAGDLEALAQAVVAVSHLAALPEVAEAEINPLLVGPQGGGATALDALVRLTEG